MVGLIPEKPESQTDVTGMMKPSQSLNAVLRSQKASRADQKQFPTLISPLLKATGARRQDEIFRQRAYVIAYMPQTLGSHPELLAKIHTLCIIHSLGTPTHSGKLTSVFHCVFRCVSRCVFRTRKYKQRDDDCNESARLFWKIKSATTAKKNCWNVKKIKKYVLPFQLFFLLFYQTKWHPQEFANKVYLLAVFT